jgi:uncharacterized membrane protein
MSQANVSADATSDDKLWVLLAYILTPLVPIIILLMQDKKDRPFIKAHNFQALAVGLVNVVLCVVVGWTVVGLCLPGILWLLCVYWGIQGYNGKYVNIPLITNFVKNQGWA